MNNLCVRPISDMEIISETDNEVFIMIVGSDCDGSILDKRMANLFFDIERARGLDYNFPIHISEIFSLHKIVERLIDVCDQLARKNSFNR